MSIQTFTMPDPGEGLTEAEIVSWHVAVGDEITVNQVFVEVETAKAVVELPSPFAGRVAQLMAEPGQSVDVGRPLIRVDTAGGGAGTPSVPDTVAAPDTTADAGSTQGAEAAGAKIGETTADGRIATLVGFVSPGAGSRRRPRGGAAFPPPTVVRTPPAARTVAGPPPAPADAPRATPPVRKLAKDLGVDLADIAPVRSDGVITRAEVEGAVAPAPGTSGAARERRVPVRGVRKLMAQAMVASAFTAPHVTEFLTVDVTAMMALREKLRRFPAFTDVKLTPLAFAAQAVCLAARRTPEINSSWDGEHGEIVVKEYVHLGIAANTPRGLVVPVLRDADAMDLVELARGLTALADTARSGRTAPADLTGGTFTITNVGVFGIDTGTPIINPGESAILALGSIRPMPWVVEGDLAVRQVCQLALSFDHRVLDGAQGSQFLADVGALLAEPGLIAAF